MINENDIIKGCKKNDPECQRYIYEKYYKMMYGICVRYTKNSVQAKDFVQDGFIKIFQKVRKFKGQKEQIVSWMTTVLKNMLVDKLKKEIHHIGIDPNDLYPALKDENEDDQQSPLAYLNSEEIILVIQQLPTGYRTVLNLYAIDGHSHKEIAKMLKISENTSKSQLFKARRLLRTKCLQKIKALTNEI